MNNEFFYKHINFIIEKNFFSTLEKTFKISERKYLVAPRSTSALESTMKNLSSPFSTSSRIEGHDIIALSKPLVNWTKDEVQQWFKSSKYSDYARRFLGLDGKDLAGLTEVQFQKELGNIQGSAL